MKRLWGRLLLLVRLGRMLVSSNLEDVVLMWGVKRIFTNSFRFWCQSQIVRRVIWGILLKNCF